LYFVPIYSILDSFHVFVTAAAKLHAIAKLPAAATKLHIAGAKLSTIVAKLHTSSMQRTSHHQSEVSYTEISL
jgi:hypothetical protein